MDDRMEASETCGNCGKAPERGNRFLHCAPAARPWSIAPESARGSTGGADTNCHEIPHPNESRAPDSRRLMVSSN